MLETKEAVHTSTSIRCTLIAKCPKLVFLVTSLRLSLHNALGTMTNLRKKLSDRLPGTTQVIEMVTPTFEAQSIVGHLASIHGIKGTSSSRSESP